MTINQPAGAGSTALSEAGVPNWPKEDTAAGKPSGRRARRGLSPSARREQRWFYLLTSPWMIGFVLFGGGPVIASGVMSFTNWSILSTPHWAGLANYREMVHDSTFWTALWNTLYFGFGSVVVSLVLTFCMALLLNQRVRGLWFFRLVFYLPTVTSGIATALLWEVLLDPSYGLINRILAVFGIPGPGWLASTTWAMPALIIMSVWGAGNTIVIYLAGLQGVPPALYEAASIDGAGWWRRLWHVTLPMMSPVIFFNCVTGFIVTLQSYVLILVMTQGGPGNATMVLGLYIYREAFEYYNLGYASAMAWVMLVVILIITLAQFLVGRRFVHFESGRGEA